MNARDRLHRNYRTALLRYLPGRDEAALTAGYEIGRTAVTDDLTILDLVHVHHDVLRDVLRTSGPDEQDQVVLTAADFQGEVLATFEMARRAYLERP